MQQIDKNVCEDVKHWQAMQGGDKDAFAALYERYFKSTLWYESVDVWT